MANEIGNAVKKLLVVALGCLLFGIVVHFFWSSATFARGQRFDYMWSDAWRFVAFALAACALWEVWGRIHSVSRIRFANFFEWDWLLRNIEQSIPVTRIVPGALIAIYASVFLLDLQTGDGWWATAAKRFNEEIMHIDILGRVRLDAYDIFRLEVLGFAIGLAIYAIAFATAPYVYVVDDKSVGARAVLVRTMRKDGHLIPTRHMASTLNYFIRLWDPVGTLEWRHSRTRLEGLERMADSDPRKGVVAAAVVSAFPTIDEDFGALTDSLFNVTKPILRLVLVVMLAASTLLVLLPIVLRAILVLFPVLEGGH